MDPARDAAGWQADRRWRLRLQPEGATPHDLSCRLERPGALHFGIDLVKPSDFIRRTMPQWEEPPIHQDLVTFDTTVTAGDMTIVERGFLMALRDPAVVEMASRYGDPVDLLEGTT